MAVLMGFTPFDVGFAEGSTAHVQYERRLDGIAAFVPHRSPIVRVDLDWWYVQPEAGADPRWDRLDPIVDGAAARGMRILLVLGYAPPWANGGKADDKWFPVADAPWTAIVDAAVRHFGGRVQAYEVWNEPNNLWFGGYDGDRKARYWQLVRLANQAVKGTCPACVVVAGASGAGGSVADESATWLDWAYTNGFGANFDAVAHHPYPAWNVGFGPERSECVNRWWNMFGPPGENPACGELALVHSVMVAHGDTAKKIWATEFGYPTGGLPARTVRDHLVRGVHMWRSLGYAGPLFLYSYRDACSNLADPECRFGMVTEAFQRKQPMFTDVSLALDSYWKASLGTGEILRRWSGMRALDGSHEMWLQDDGNLVIYAAGAPIWATGTTGGDRLVNQGDGNLVLYRANGSVAWASGTDGNGPSTLWLQEDGNLVLYRDSDAKPTWASKSGRLPGI